MSTSTKSSAASPPKPNIKKPDVLALRASMNAPIPNQGTAGIKPGDNYDEAFQRLPVMQIKRYDYNPRVKANPAYVELKDSIRSTQAKNVVLTITRRPGDSEYICAAGGNTTLTAVQELWEETHDPAYETVKTLFTKWTDDVTVIIAHLAENENRADICFWDKAKAIVDLKARLEKEQNGTIIPIEGFITEIKKKGLNSNTTTVRAYFFATEQLKPIGQWLTLPATKALQPRVNQLRKVAAALGLPVHEIDSLVRQTLEKQAIALAEIESGNPQIDVTVDAPATCSALDQAFAQALDISLNELVVMLSTASVQTGQLSGQALRDAAKAAITIQSTTPVVADRKSTTVKPQTPTPARQLPLQPAMLAPLQDASKPSRPASSEASSTAQAEQTTSPGAGAPSTPQDSTLHTQNGGLFKDPAWMTLRATGPTDDPTHPDHAAGTVLALIRDISDACALHDLVFVAPAMPLGFYCELPTQPFSGEFVMSQPPNDNVDDPEWSGRRAAALRRSGWQLLVALSGQCDSQLLRKLPRESQWRQSAEAGNLSSIFKSLGMGSTDPNRGGIQISVVDIYRFMYAPELGDLFLALWSWVQRWVQNDPDRFPFEIYPAR